MHPNKRLTPDACAQAFIEYGNYVAVLLQQATIAEPPVRDAALRYAVEREWHVFPAHSSGERKSHKSSKNSNGKLWGATKEPAAILRLQRERGRPEADQDR